ncbi:MAG: hypothetical protein K9M02_11700 [Thiohalocapsa sp.]|nr:hypothetical protein [Thiohalocapsa sp.]
MQEAKDTEGGFDGWPGDDYSALDQGWYEHRMIVEARAIANGECAREPTTEHLRIVLRRLDACTMCGFVEQQPF